MIHLLRWFLSPHKVMFWLIPLAAPFTMLMIITQLSLNYVSVIEFLENQLVSDFISVNIFPGISWFEYIYSTFTIDNPATILDCLNQCRNVQSAACQFFVYLNGTCFLGRSSISNGTVSGVPANTIVTIYFLSSMFTNIWRPKFLHHFNSCTVTFRPCYSFSYSSHYSLRLQLIEYQIL